MAVGYYGGGDVRCYRAGEKMMTITEEDIIKSVEHIKTMRRPFVYYARSKEEYEYAKRYYRHVKMVEWVEK